MDCLNILETAVKNSASDIFFIAGRPVTYKINNRIAEPEGAVLSPSTSKTLVQSLYALAGDRDPEHLQQIGDDDFSFSVPGLSRFRVNVYRQRSSLAAVVRVITFHLPDPKELNIPDFVMELSMQKKGLVLITGPAGSGKTTTLSCMIDRINTTRSCHIITLEDPLEYIHYHKKSIVSQREIPMDTPSYAHALRAALRQSPDVILLGEMRDYETINIAMTAAETGHLVLSTLHTVGAANAIDRIVDVFPENQQTQIRVQLSMVTKAIVSQQLIPGKSGNPIPALEIMICNSAVHNMIREAKTHQIDAVISSSSREGMISMNESLAILIKADKITVEEAMIYSLNPTQLKKML